MSERGSAEILMPTKLTGPARTAIPVPPTMSQKPQRHEETAVSAASTAKPLNAGMVAAFHDCNLSAVPYLCKKVDQHKCSVSIQLWGFSIPHEFIRRENRQVFFYKYDIFYRHLSFMVKKGKHQEGSNNPKSKTRFE